MGRPWGVGFSWDTATMEVIKVINTVREPMRRMVRLVSPMTCFFHIPFTKNTKPTNIKTMDQQSISLLVIGRVIHASVARMRHDNAPAPQSV